MRLTTHSDVVRLKAVGTLLIALAAIVISMKAVGPLAVEGVRSAFSRSQSSDHGTCADETRTGRKVASISVGGRSRKPHSSPQIKPKLAAQHRLPAVLPASSSRQPDSNGFNLFPGKTLRIRH